MSARRALVETLLRRSWTLAALALIVVIVSLLGGMGPESLERTVLAALVNLVIVVGLYIFIGNSGVFSFGHLAFTAVGAYVGAVLIIPPETKELLYPEMLGFLRDVHLPAVPATIVAGLSAALFAAVLAIPLMRMSGLTAALGTFAVLIAFNVVANNWVQGTNASAGLSAIPVTVGLAEPLLWALTAMAGAFLFQQTRSCMRLRASREDEVAARAIAIRIPRERGVAFCISAFFMGVGGALFAQTQGAVTPDAFYLTLTFFAIAMLVVGGINSLTGAVIGVVLVSTVSELLRRMEGGLDLGAFTVDAPTGLTEVTLALVMIVVLVLRPAGITGGRELTWPFGRAPSAPPEPEASTS